MSTVSDQVLSRFREIATPTIYDSLWVKGWPAAMVVGSRSLYPGRKLVGRAVTLRFVPQRPDLLADKPKGGESPEYQAMELCGPNEVLVASSIGPWESVGGDIKFFRLMQLGVGGVVTDGSVRDYRELEGYGFPVFAHATTAKQGPSVMYPWGVNEVITCGGTAVRPGDVIVGDDDGVVVVPAAVAEEVLEMAAEREAIERVIKTELERNPGPPGKYYPFTDEARKLFDEYKARGEA